MLSIAPAQRFLHNLFIFISLLAPLSALAFNEEDKLNVTALLNEYGLVLKELSITLTLSNSDDLIQRNSEIYEFHQQTNTPVSFPVLVFDKKPISNFDKVLLLRYLTKHGFKEDDKVQKEIGSFVRPITTIADNHGLQLISIKSTKIITQTLKDNREKDYHFEMTFFFYKQDDGQWVQFLDKE